MNSIPYFKKYKHISKSLACKLNHMYFPKDSSWFAYKFSMEVQWFQLFYRVAKSTEAYKIIMLYYMIKLHIFNYLPKAFLCETGMFTFWKWVMVKNENLGALSWFVLRSISLSHDCFCMIGTNLNTVKYHCFDLKMHWKDLRVSSGDHRPHLKKIHIRRIFTFALFLLLYFEPQVHLRSLKLSVLFSC